MTPVQHVSTRPPQRHGVSRPDIKSFSSLTAVALHDEQFSDEIYDPISELTLRQTASSLLDEGKALTIFQKAEWNQDGSSRYPIVDSSEYAESDEEARDNYHAEFYVVLPGLALNWAEQDVPIIWEVRDQRLRDASTEAYFHGPSTAAITWEDLPEKMKNPHILTVDYISTLEDWKDAEGNEMQRVVGLRPVKIRFSTPPPDYGYMAANRFNVMIEMAVEKLKAWWLEGLYFKVEGSILGLNDRSDFNYVAEMTDFERQTDAIEVLLVNPEELVRKIDTSKAKPDISPKEARIEELEAMFESYIRAHPDAPKDYMTISIVMGLSDEYYKLLEEFGEL